MFRKVLLIFVGVASLWFCSKGFSQQAVKIGFISLKKVSDESLKTKAFKGEIEKLVGEKRSLLNAIRKEIADLETARALSGPEQAKKEQQKIAQKRMELLKLENELRREIEKRQTVFEKDILRDIADAVKEIAEEKGYTWVLFDEVLLYKDESADLTFQTLVKINDKYTRSRSQPETKPEGEVPSEKKLLPVSGEETPKVESPSKETSAADK